MTQSQAHLTHCVVLLRGVVVVGDRPEGMVRAFKIATSHFEGYLVETVGYPHVPIAEQDFPLHFRFALDRSNTLTRTRLRTEHREGEQQHNQSAT